MSDVSVPTTPANPDDLREQTVSALDEMVTEYIHPNEFGGYDVDHGALADVVLPIAAQHFAPVLEGLRAELDAAVIQRDKFGQLHLSEAKTHDETIQSLREAQAEVEQWRATFGETALRDATAIIAERDALRAERDSERESRIAWALEADRLQQEQTHLIKAVLGLTDQRAALSSLLRGMARRVSQKREEIRELAALVPCGWCNGTGIAPEESFGRDGDGAPMVDGDQPCPEGCRPSVSDQTPAKFKETARNLNSAADIQGNCNKPAPAVPATSDEDVCPCPWCTNPAPSSVQGDTTPDKETDRG